MRYGKEKHDECAGGRSGHLVSSSSSLSVSARGLLASGRMKTDGAGDRRDREGGESRGQKEETRRERRKRRVRVRLSGCFYECDSGSAMVAVSRVCRQQQQQKKRRQN